VFVDQPDQKLCCSSINIELKDSVIEFNTKNSNNLTILPHIKLVDNWKRKKLRIIR